MSNVSTTTAAIYQAVLDSLNSSGECGVLPPAPPGKSAYEVAVANGFKGSEKQWLDSLQHVQQQEIARLEARIVAAEKFTKDSKHAASRLVDTKDDDSLVSTGKVREVVLSGTSGAVYRHKESATVDVNDFAYGSVNLVDANPQNSPHPLGVTGYSSIQTWRVNAGKRQIAYHDSVGDMYSRQWNGVSSHAWSPWAKHYTSGNTTVDSNKNIKTSSPVVRVFSDKLDKIHEANDLPIKYSRNGVGDYTIEGTTGLRENDWQIVIPEDDHKNQMIAFTIEDVNGTIHLKTYKRTFSMETFTFGPDLKSPLDIPEGRWVDLHFNDLPQEELDEPELEPEDVEVEEPEVTEEEPVVEEEEVPVEEGPKD